jgi:cytochrome P450
VSVTLPDPVSLPDRRSCALDPPDEYARLRADRPWSRLRLPGGQIGWLVTRYEDVRAILEDSRFSPPLIQVTPADSMPVPDEAMDVPPGTFSALDPPEQSRYRRLVSRYFTRRQTRELEPRMEQLVNEHLDTMIGGGCPADLISQFAEPMPAILISDMLGIPASERADYQHRITTMLSLAADTGELDSARTGIYAGLGALILAKREHPGNDIISDLLRAPAGLSDEEVVNMTALLLITGLETTTYQLGLGAFVLLRHPGQVAALRTEPALIEPMVEELLRYQTIVQHGLTRSAREDVDLRGQRIRAGETVIVSLAAANRDFVVYADPDRLDARRTASSHLAFGSGVHRCLGAQLARAEMKVGLGTLFRRLPSLRLAVPAEQVEMLNTRIFYGVRSLPVAWDDRDVPNLAAGR